MQRELDNAKSGLGSSRPEETAIRRGDQMTLRVSPNNYFAAIFLGTFFTGLFLYLEWDSSALVLFLLSWGLLPLLLWYDRITFDGDRLERNGIIPRLWYVVNGDSPRISVDDIELVETQALRALRRGGDVVYRYRTIVSGLDRSFVLVSGGDDYRKMTRKLFSMLPENVLDGRSLELRDYLSEPKSARIKASSARIPSSAVLESSIASASKEKRIQSRSETEGESPDTQKVDELRQLANELRLSGYLLQALEAFRRALRISPQNGWLLYEFARCLHSYAGAERDGKLERKALAALRLAERRAENDASLMLRLGETYFQFGDWKRSKQAFERLLGSEQGGFRAVKGLAELSLREGKIAHVIHHFASAVRYAETPALRRWTSAEAEYFSRLNSDEDYMDMEVSRVNMLDSLERAKRLSLRIALASLPPILIGLVFGLPLIVNIGWSVSCVALLIWAGMIMSLNLLSSRIPLESGGES